MKWIGSFVLALALTLAGCDLHVYRTDLTPPSEPRGLYTRTGDRQLELNWLSNPEPDVAGYNVFVSSSYNGRYDLIGSTAGTRFVDLDARNGTTYYYAVSAYDYAGNESELSRDVIYDTPRPEGCGVQLFDYRSRPNVAGYDFSTYTVGPYNDRYTDVFFENYNGSYYLNVWEDSDIQDMGYTTSLSEIGYAPEGGWSPTKDARIIPGHTYVVWTCDNHYAKLRVVSVSGTRVVFDWAYQLQSGNPRLRPLVGTNGRLPELGDGALRRSATASVREQ